jgi:hypothetical protein
MTNRQEMTRSLTLNESFAVIVITESVPGHVHRDLHHCIVRQGSVALELWAAYSTVWWRQYDDFREWSTPRSRKYGFGFRSTSALGLAVLVASDRIRRTESLPVGFDEVVSG